MQRVVTDMGVLEESKLEISVMTAYVWEKLTAIDLLHCWCAVPCHYKWYGGQEINIGSLGGYRWELFSGPFSNCQET